MNNKCIMVWQCQSEPRLHCKRIQLASLGVTIKTEEQNQTQNPSKELLFLAQVYIDWSKVKQNVGVK